jgi:hypothetical protein
MRRDAEKKKRMQLYLSRMLQDHAALNRTALNWRLVAEQRGEGRLAGWITAGRLPTCLSPPTPLLDRSDSSRRGIWL